MDYEEVANFTFDEDFTPERSVGTIAHEIVFAIFCTLGVFTDAAITFTILRFRRMRTIPHILIANWAIADLFSLIVTPSGYRIFSVIDQLSLPPELMCALTHFGTILHFTVLTFVIFVNIDWFVAVQHPRASEAVRNYHKHVIGAIWIISLVHSGVTTGMCMADRNSYYSHIQLLCLLWANTIITVALQIWRAVRKYYLKKPIEYPSLTLTLTTSFGGCWLLAFIAMYIDGFYLDLTPLTTMVICLIFGSSLVNFTLLFCLSKDFQACLRQVFRRSGNPYQEANFDFDNPVFKSTTVGNSPTVTLSFDKDEELLITD